MKVLLTGLLAAASLYSASAEIRVSSIEDDLFYDENGKLVTHHLFYPAGNPNCPAASFRPPYGFVSRALEGEALQAVFPGYEGEGCPVACAERGTDRSVAYAIMPHKTNDGSDDLASWFDHVCNKVEVCLMNYVSKEHPVKTYWLDPQGGKRIHMEIEYGERKTRCFNSYIGHRFEAYHGGTDEFLEAYTVEFTLSRAFGDSPPSGSAEGMNIDSEIESTLHHEWTKHNRIQRTFSPLGFKKSRLPDDVFASIGSFYYNNRKFSVREEWKGKGVFVNWWETDCYFIQVPWDTKKIWQVRLRELVEAWAGVTIEQTDMYGLRKYVQNARLLTHVDRETTHAVSLIVNIAQGNLTEPWPVEVYDHADRLHEVLMSPGDIVYYESAKSLHGRSRPLMGPNAYYVNLFTHYRPVGDPEWMKKPNTEGTPDPLVEVEGECKLKPVGMKELPNEQLAIVEGVTCDDPRLGDTISPTLFTAASGYDLINWWQMTGENRPALSAAQQ